MDTIDELRTSRGAESLPCTVCGKDTELAKAYVLSCDDGIDYGLVPAFHEDAVEAWLQDLDP